MPYNNNFFFHFSLKDKHIRISLKECCCYQGSYWTKGSCWLSWSHHFESFTVATVTWLTVMEYLCHKWQRICSTCRKHFPALSSFMTCHRIWNYINTMGVPNGAGTAYPSGAPEFTPVSSGVRVTRSLVLCVCFVDRCLSFCPFSFGQCVVCSSSIYGFWLPLWYFQTLLLTTQVGEWI